MRPARRVGAFAALASVIAVLAACTSSGSSGPSTVVTSSASSPTDAVPSSASSTAAATSTAPSTPAASSSSATVTYRSGLAVPDPVATPGSALPGVGRSQICSSTWNAAHNKIGFSVQNAVSTRYDVLAGGKTSLHLDQLIPAALGGSVTTANVWPQPASQVARKNALESHLHQLVCSGALSLSTAQQAMATDWTSALRRYPPT